MEPQLTNVFTKNLAAYRSGSNLIINQGGQGSSKTFSILQLLYLIAKKETKRITVVSYALPHLKHGAMADFDKILKSFGENLDIKNRTESVYFIGNSTIDFFGVESNIEKAHGPRRDILFVNECNRKVSYDVFDHLNTRTQECTFLDFNPDQEFWLHDRVIPNFKHTLIKSNYLDNPWLPENELRNILMKKDKPGFENWWTVYGLGELGKLEGAILSNWHYGEFDVSLPYGYGCDFGFNDPDTLIKIAVDKKKKIIYADQKIYKEGNSADQFRQMISFHANRNDAIIADCADARMISELKRYFNISPVNKAKWTVPEALKMMQDYEIIITDTSYDLARELNNYIWSDRKAGVPIGDFNHAIDAMRYYFQHFLDKPAGMTIQELSGYLTI
jgi:phage terminase large subunit